jgi:hypothetical protein
VLHRAVLNAVIRLQLASSMSLGSLARRYRRIELAKEEGEQRVRGKAAGDRHASIP